jgi:predicted nucleic acid-binding protein
VIVFVDTSALYAVLDRDDSNHAQARAAWERLLKDGATLVTTNYVLVETSALVQHRLGVGALRTLHEDIIPLLTTEWVTESRHAAGVSAVLTAARKRLSLVDCVSFQVMREIGLREAFSFDAHFAEQGFEVTSGD